MTTTDSLPQLASKIYEFEIDINRNIQKQLNFAEHILRDVNIYLDPQMIMDVWLPLVGSLNHKLLIRLAVSTSILNVLTSLVKWVSPEYRPIWLLKEFKSFQKMKEFNTDINTCDTSAGFPSSHAVTFTAFAFIFFHWMLSQIGKYCYFGRLEKYLLSHVLVSLPLSLIWCSRMYFLTEFLHQCIGGSLFAIGGLHLLQHYSSYILKLKKWLTTASVVMAGLLPLTIYFLMLQLSLDPHWSVRMAFKWCSELTLMRHEAGPIFVLFRDFGYLLGVALSCPLLQSYKNNNGSIYKRLPIILLVIFLNLTARQYTPKHLGRWVFLAYELGRNCMQSYFLMTILPKILK